MELSSCFGAPATLEGVNGRSCHGGMLNLARNRRQGTIAMRV